MKCFVDGDQVCVVHDDFVDLQESPSVFVPLASVLGYELSNYGIEGARPELALEFLIEQRLCLTPIMESMWTAFPQRGWDVYGAKNARHSIVEAILLGALAVDEVKKRRYTGLACTKCRGKVVRDVLEKTVKCECLSRPLYKQAKLDVPVSETVPEDEMPPQQWVPACLVLDEV